MALTSPKNSPKRALLTGVGLSAFLTFTHGTNDAFTSMLAALLPTLQERFLLSETALALLVATLSFGSSVTQPLFGALSDRLGRRLLGGLGVILSSSLLSLMGVAPSVYLLFGLLLVGGLGSAAFHPSATSMARAAAGGNKGLAVGIFSAGGTVGLALGPLVIGALIVNDLLPFSPWLMVPGVLLGVLMMLFVPKQERAPRQSRPKLFDIDLFRGPVGALCLSGVLRSLSYVTFINAVSLWLVNVRGLDREDPTLFWTLTVFNFAAGLGGILAGALSARMGRRGLTVGAMLLAVPLLFLIFWLPAPSVLFFVAVALAGALTNAPVPLLIVSAQDLAPHAVATATGMLMGLTWGSAGVLYIFIGRLQETLGITAAMSLSYLFLIPAAALAFYVMSKNRHALTE